MTLAELSLKRPVTVIMAFVSMTVIGLIAAFRLPLVADARGSHVYFWGLVRPAGKRTRAVARSAELGADVVAAGVVAAAGDDADLGAQALLVKDLDLSLLLARQGVELHRPQYIAAFTEGNAMTPETPSSDQKK